MDPSIYLVDEGNRVLTDLPKTSENTTSVRESSEDNTATLAKQSESKKFSPEEGGASADRVVEVTENLGSVDLAKNASNYQGYLMHCISISVVFMLWSFWVYFPIYILFGTLSFTCFLERNCYYGHKMWMQIAGSASPMAIHNIIPNV